MWNSVCLCVCIDFASLSLFVYVCVCVFGSFKKKWWKEKRKQQQLHQNYRNKTSIYLQNYANKMKRKNDVEFPLWNRQSFIVKMASALLFSRISHLIPSLIRSFLFFRFVKSYIISSLLCDRVSERTSDYMRTHSCTIVFAYVGLFDCVCMSEYDDQNRSANKRNSTTKTVTTSTLDITVKKALFSAEIRMYLTLNDFSDRCLSSLIFLSLSAQARGTIHIINMLQHN